MSAPKADPFNVERFVTAQAAGYEQALAELRAGRKQSHWIWYVLPQLRGLGRSDSSEFFGITGLAEARAYLAHEILRPRLIRCVEAIADHRRIPIEGILGHTDALKYRSCLTLFAEVADDRSAFAKALALHFAGEPDQRTLRLLAGRAAE